MTKCRQKPIHFDIHNYILIYILIYIYIYIYITIYLIIQLYTALMDNSENGCIRIVKVLRKSYVIWYSMYCI